MKILVTGGAGFIGSHLVDKLVAQKHQVSIIDNLSCGNKKIINSKTKFFNLDVRSPKLKEVLAKVRPEIVYHLAAQKSVLFSLKKPLADATINVWGSLKILEAIQSIKIKKFIFFSSGGAIYCHANDLPSHEMTWSSPDSPYGISKLAVDNYLINFYGRIKKMPYVSLRPANIYGPRQNPGGEAGVVAIFINNLLNKKQCYINGSGKQTRDLVYVGDAVDAAIKAMNKGFGVYNISTCKETSINALYDIIAGLITDIKPIHRPAVPGEVFRSVLSSAKAKRELGWVPKVDLIDGIKKTIAFFKKVGK